MSERLRTYAIVTPAHNEAHYLPAVIASIAAQTRLPAQWIILDDRSSDRTPALLAEAAKAYPFIQVLRMAGESRHVLGAHVADVVMQGMQRVRSQPEYLVKMDADITLPPDYFEKLSGRFEEDPRLGIASGKTMTRHGEAWIEERYPDFHVTGACKTYRASCFEEIGGLIPLYGWDILDCTRARMLGWTTRSFREHTIRHVRMTGSKHGILKGHLGHGRGMWATGAHPLFVAGRALYRATEPPYLAGLLIAVGYLLARHRREPQLEDRALMHYMRREQLRRLLGKQLKAERLRINVLRSDG
jgi:poly-beta-1,6-N-acetyl-D-glucosamine synthase